MLLPNRASKRCSRVFPEKHEQRICLTDLLVGLFVFDLSPLYALVVCGPSELALASVNTLLGNTAWDRLDQSTTITDEKKDDLTDPI